METLPNKHHPFDLESRLVKFYNMIGDLSHMLSNSQESNILRRQILRSGSSATLNYGEAQVTQTDADFIHKMSICLKELKETEVAIKIIEIRRLCVEKQFLTKVMGECSELVKIFYKSIDTKRQNMNPK